MEQLTEFYVQYGWQMALIAVAGIIILGILKYTNAFSKIDKEKRKPIYFAFSLGFSIISTVVYLLIIEQFNVAYVFTVSVAIYALNQTMYSVYETTTLRDLVTKIGVYLNQKKQIKKEKTEDSENANKEN